MALVRIQVRRDTASDWSANNPVLAEGEIGFELDTARIKVGDGVRNWLNLPYTSGALPATSGPLDVGARSAGSSLLYARADHSHALPSAVTVVSLTAGRATIAGDLSVTGSLIGGTHTHTVASITNWGSATSDAVWQNLAAGSNVTLSRDPETGVTTIDAAAGDGGDVSSVAGRTGDVVLTISDLSNFPSVTTNAGKFLKTDGEVLEWADPYAGGGVATLNELVGNPVIQAGSNVEVLTNPSTGIITINSTASGGTGDVTSVNALVGALTIAAAAGSGLSVSAAGSTIALDATIDYADLANVPASFTPASHTHAVADITDFSEAVEDAVDGLLVAGTNVTLTYDDAGGTLTIDAAGASAPTLLEGYAIAIDTSVAGEAEISVDGTLDGGFYEGVALAADPAYFSIQPESQLVTFGTAIFTARVENAESPSYQWQKAEAGTDAWNGLSDVSPYSGVTTNTLNISPVSDSDNGDRFRLQVTHSGGNVLVSNEAVLSTVALFITDQPLSGEFEEADTIDVEPFLLAITDGGTPPYSHQWQKWDGSAWADVSGETSYYVDSISGVLGANEPQRVERWRVKITDSVGVSIISDEARITIRAGVPLITLDPTDQTIASGSATFTCEYQGKGASQSWERRYPSQDDFFAIGQAGTITTPTPGTYRSVLTLSGLTGNDNGSEYRLRVGNFAGDAVSAAATLGTSAPIISSQPQSATVVENIQAAFTVVASYGGGAITYQWQEKTAGGSWANLSGATSATLTLPGVSVPLGRDGSEFRVLVTGGGVTTTSKPAMLTVISAPDAGDEIFTIHPKNETIEEGGSYSLSAVSSWLETTDHYAAVRVQYDNGAVEYHPLATGTSWNGTVTRGHRPLAHQEYSASVLVAGSADVSVIVSSLDPTSVSTSGGTTTLQPWALAKIDRRNCSISVDPSQPRTGVISHPVPPQDFNLRLASGEPHPCAGAGISVPDLPYSYVESRRARVTVAPRQAFIGPVPSTGFWNPPNEYSFTGACDPSGQLVLAASSGSSGSYLYSTNGGKSWMTRHFPYSVTPHKMLYAFGKFYLFTGSGGMSGPVNQPDQGVGSALESTDGRSWSPTGWNFGRLAIGGGVTMYPSLAGGRLYNVTVRTGYITILRSVEVDLGNGRRYYALRPQQFVRHYTDIWSKTQNGPWVLLKTIDNPMTNGSNGPESIPPRPGWVCHAHGRWYYKSYFSADGVDFADTGFDPGGARFFGVTLPDQTQNYVLSDSNYYAPVDASGFGTTNWLGASGGQTGGGPQAGDWLYFAQPENDCMQVRGVRECTRIGMGFYRKHTGNPGVSQKLMGHSTYWTGNQLGPWADIQVMSWYFGSAYGPNLDMNYLTTVSDPLMENAIVTPERILHLFGYRYPRLDAPSNRRPGGGSIPVPVN